MVKKLLKPMCCLLVTVMVFAFASCGKTVQYESYYEEVPGQKSTDASGSAGDNSADKSSSGNTNAASNGQTDPKTPGKTTSLSRDGFIASMPSNLKGTKLKLFLWDDIRSNPLYGAVLKDFQKATGITAEIQIANKPTYDAELAANISAGKSPDMVIVIENNLYNVSNLQPITNTGYDFNDTAWDKDIMRDFTFNGKCYAVNVQNSPNRNMGVICYNKKALKRAGMSADDPYTVWKRNPGDWNWAKLWSMCDNFLKANNNKEGYYGITWGTEDGYVKSFAGCLWRYDSQKGQVVNCSANADTVKRYGELIDAINKKWSTSVCDNTSFDAGKILFNWSYSSSSEKGNEAFTALKEGDNLGFVPMPTDSTVQPIFSYCSYGVPVGAKNAAAVPYLVRYLFGPESYKDDDFYINKEAAEVVNYMIKKGNFFFGNGYKYNIWQDMIRGTGSNVKSVLDSYQGEINNDVSGSNTLIKKLHN